MLLDAILAPLKEKSLVKLIPETTHPSITQIFQNPFYISPSFSEVTIDKRQPKKDAKFILFSAPGATGKSALAKYLAYKFNAIYWNLAEIKLGDNSFTGTILKAVGAIAYSSFVEKLSNSETMLIADACDEAELVCGRKMLESFILEINELLKESTSPSVVLLARTETAQFISSLLTGKEISFIHYEIGFFEKEKRKDFVLAKLANDKDITKAERECVNEYLSRLESFVPANTDDGSFLGYAPVLEAISKHIKEVKNVVILTNELSQSSSSALLTLSIMSQLLSREQKKVEDAFQQYCKSQNMPIENPSSIYSPVEQMVRIMYYILFHDTKYENYKVPGIPSEAVSQYTSIVEKILPQHPFIQATTQNKGTIYNFTGPAFRDYILASLLVDKENSDIASMYFEEIKSTNEMQGSFSYFPSQLFWDYYLEKTDNILESNHLSYLYESFKARATAQEELYMQINEEISEKDESKYYLAGFGKKKKKGSIDEPNYYKLLVNDGIIKLDQISNVQIDTPSLNIQLGIHLEELRIYNSSIICNKLILNSQKIILEGYLPTEGCLLVSKVPVETKYSYVQFEKVGSADPKISFPNIDRFYSLYSYKYDFEDTSNIDIVKFVHALRAIFISFRTHKKDALAKQAERIDNVVVGANTLKKDVLNFLKFEGVIYEVSPMYKIDSNKMQGLKISFSSLAQCDTHQSEEAFKRFCTWKRK